MMKKYLALAQATFSVDRATFLKARLFSFNRYVLAIGISAMALQAQAALVSVGIVNSDPSYSGDVVNKLSGTGLFSSVSLINAQFSTPTLSTLQGYGAVLVYSDFSWANDTLLGNVLADYVDAGGGVVTAAFTNVSGISTTIGGRYASGGYAGITPSALAGGTQLTLGTVYNSGSPIMTGVTSFNGGTSSYSSTGTVTAGAVRVADWSNGAPLVVTKSVGGHTTVHLNFFPPSSDIQSDFWQSSTQGTLLMANALNFAAGNVAPAVVPIPAAAWLMLSGIGALAATTRRRNSPQTAHIDRTGAHA